MNKILSVIALAGLLLTASARAQTYGTIALTTAPASVILNTSSNFSSIIDCRANRNVTFDIAGRCLTATNTTYILTVVRSLDAAVFETASLSPYIFTLTIPTNGTTYHLITNVDVGACGYLIPTNSAAGAGTVTNVTVTVALKPGN
jgi:hypothetical protein